MTHYTPKLHMSTQRLLHEFITASDRKQPKCHLTGKYIDKSWCIHTLAFHSEIKMSELLMHITWVYFRISRLSGGSQAEKGYILFDSIDTNSRTCKLIHERRKQVRVAWAREWRWGGLQRGTRKFWVRMSPT